MPRLSTAYQALLREYPDSVRINSVSWGAEALFCRLLARADGAGGFYGHAKDVVGKVCARRLGRSTSEEEVEGFLRELEEVGLILRWSTGHERWLRIVNYYDAGSRLKVRYPSPPKEVMENVPLLGADMPLLGADVPLSDHGTGDRGKGAVVGGLRPPDSAIAESPPGSRAKRSTARAAKVEKSRKALRGLAASPWVLEVLHGYLDARDASGCSASDFACPTTVTGWGNLGSHLLDHGEHVCRAALAILESENLKRLRNAISLYLDEQRKRGWTVQQAEEKSKREADEVQRLEAALRKVEKR